MRRKIYPGEETPMRSAPFDSAPIPDSVVVPEPMLLITNLAPALPLSVIVPENTSLNVSF